MVVAIVELEIEAPRRRDGVVEQGAVRHEVPQADAFPSAVVDLHVLHDHAVYRGQVVVAFIVRQVAVLAGTFGGRRGGEGGGGGGLKINSWKLFIGKNR